MPHEAPSKAAQVQQTPANLSKKAKAAAAPMAATAEGSEPSQTRASADACWVAATLTEPCERVPL